MEVSLWGEIVGRKGEMLFPCNTEPGHHFIDEGKFTKIAVRPVPLFLYSAHIS
jgi:hypothetical protein